MKARSTFPARKLAGSIVAALAFVCQGSNASDAYSANYPTGGMDVRINSQLSERMGAMALTGRFQTEVPRYLRGGRASSRQVAAEVTARRPAATVQVTNCDDSGSGSLRDTIASAVSGDTVNLSELTCSTITLTTGYIAVEQDDLTIVGPGASAFAIDGGGVLSLFAFYGSSGTLDGVTITNGYYAGPSGACLIANGDLTVRNAVVSNCVLHATSGGGSAMYVHGDLTIENSVVAHNYAEGTEFVEGAAAVVGGDLTILYSSISDNVATSGQTSLGGGIVAKRSAVIQNSTFSGNESEIVPAIVLEARDPLATAVILNSTISDNRATSEGLGSIYTKVPLAIYNSTVAFNSGPSFSGLFAYNAPITLQSVILADNASLDLEAQGTATVGGSNNLITRADTMPPGTITACPQLEPLTDNGGSTLTHALRSVSPAIDMGSNSTSAQFDQRGPGYARVFGAAPDIGAVEWEGLADERLFKGGFESGCDE